MLIPCAKFMINNRLLFIYSPVLRDQICFLSLFLFIIDLKKSNQRVEVLCFNAFYNVTVMHFNSILWEEQLRNKGLQCGLTCLPFSLLFLPHFSLTPPHSIQSFWLPIILAQTEIYSKRRESENHLALSSGAPMASESLNSALRGFGSHWERGKERKGWRGLECGSGSGGRNVSSLFVSVCGAWWMSWVDVMTWLIAQTLNKSPILQQASPSGTPPQHCCQPTWADIVAARGGGSDAPLSRFFLGWGGWGGELGMTVKMAGADTPHLQCCWHPNGWGVFLRPVVGPRGSAGRPALMRSRGVRQCWWGQHGSSSFDEVSCSDSSDGADRGVIEWKEW